jgi:hypothetical protein
MIVGGVGNEVNVTIIENKQTTHTKKKQNKGNWGYRRSELYGRENTVGVVLDAPARLGETTTVVSRRPPI